jgi:phosphatidylserine/phosphatidylglycerophosphate/cardiolipin synthase-like enzyme
VPIWIVNTPTPATPQAAGGRPRKAVPVALPEVAGGRNCKLRPYTKKPIPSVSISSEVIAYTSPDSTFAVTKRMFDGAKKSILIGIYDFSAPHMRELLLSAMARGVKVSLMLDIDSEDETRLFDELVEMGATGVEAPSCANDTVRFFSCSHEKVIVIDDTWTMVQSGNYSDHSIPLNVVDGGDPATFRTGNRDTGVAIRSTQLAKLLGKILRDDMKLVKATPQLLRRLPRPTVFLVERAPKKQPAKLFPSLKLNLESRLTVQPVLSPDNYMDTVPALLRKAKKSIIIEQQYIRADEKKHPNVAVLLDAIAEARQNNPRLDVRIVLGKVFSAGDLDKEHTNLDTLRDKYNLKLGANIRYINTDQLVHCHNKMVVIDGAGVLVSSQNWSDTAVTKNREAGLWLPQAQVAKYFGEIFETDWKAAFKSPDTGVSRTRRATPQLLREGGFVKVVLADYEEV